MRKTRNIAALLIAASIGLAGCSDSEPSKTPADDSSSVQPEEGTNTEPDDEPDTEEPAEPEDEPEAGGGEGRELTAAPAAGTEISRPDYTFNLPADWDETPDQAPEGVDVMAGNLSAGGGFTDNLNVLPAPAGAIGLDVIETDGVAELEGAGATDVQVNERVLVGGQETSHMSATVSSPVEYVIEQYYIAADDATRIVTFSFNADTAEAERVEIAESVLASWNWS